MKISPAFIGFLRGIGIVAIVAALSYIGDASHIAFLQNSYLETLIAASALALEHKIEDKTGNPLFGVVRKA